MLCWLSWAKSEKIHSESALSNSCKFNHNSNLLILFFIPNSIWLLSYEFSDTVVLFTRNKVVFAVSAKKKALLDDMKKPDDYSGPEVEIVQKDSKTDNLNEFIDNLLTTNITGNNVAMFKKNDEEDGDLTKMLIERVKANNLKLTEM